MNIQAFKKLRDHAEFSPYKGKIKHPDIHVKGNNPLCGDELAIDFKIIKGKISEGKFMHTGCALSAASASFLIASAKGKTYKALLNTKPEILIKRLGIDISPARIPCAILPLAILKHAEIKVVSKR